MPGILPGHRIRTPFQTVSHLLVELSGRDESLLHEPPHVLEEAIQVKNMRALSVRQPYAELILRGEKQVEYRNRPARIRGRVYLYVAKESGDTEDWKEAGLRPEELPTGALVGTVEVVGCVSKAGTYEWHLANPERLPELLKPERQPQPAWFYPFSGQGVGLLISSSEKHSHYFYAVG